MGDFPASPKTLSFLISPGLKQNIMSRGELDEKAKRSDDECGWGNLFKIFLAPGACGFYCFYMRKMLCVIHNFVLHGMIYKFVAYTSIFDIFLSLSK